MKIRRQIFSFIIALLLIFNFSIIKIDIANSIALGPSQFIAEIFPNCTLPLQLTYTNTIIDIDATDLNNKNDFQFDANYTLYNPENTATVPLMIPISLKIDISKFTFEVFANNSQIQYDLFSTTTWNENITAVDVYWLPPGLDITERYNNPVTFIRTNVTLFKNSTSVIRYRFNGSVNTHFDANNFFYIAYYIGTSQEWIGNTTGRTIFTVYGKQPEFPTGGDIIELGNSTYVKFDGGGSLFYKWFNAYHPRGYIGVGYGKEGITVIMEIMLFLLPFLIVAIVVILVIILSKKRKRVANI